MSNVNIYEKKWIDLVFEDKNKSYGAYQLRQESEKTTLFAFFGSILLILSLFGGWLLFSSFNKKPEVTVISCPIGPVIRPVKLEPKVEPVKPKAVKPQASTPASENKFKKYVASKDPDTTVDVPKNTDLIPQTTTAGTDKGTGIDKPTTGGSPTGTTPAVTAPSNDPVLSSVLDRLPEYPGGIKKFYDYVGNNIEKPDVDESIGSLNVIMSFVIERDGSMSDIKVLRSSDRNLEREAIRVLKSLKIKWSPGFKDGEKVRVLYTLPIKVAL